MKRIKLGFLFLIAIGTIMLVGCSKEVTNINGGIEARYLPQIQADIKEIVGDFEPYGSMYIERTPLIKFVVAIAHPNEKTELLKKRLAETIPPELIRYRDVEYSVSELKARSMEITKKWDYYGELGADIQDIFVDEIKNNVGVTVTVISDQANQAFLSQYGDKVSIVINPPTDFSMTGYVVKRDEKRVLIVNNIAKDYGSTGGIKEYYDAVWVSGIAEKVELGQRVLVWFNGPIAESYPAQGQSDKVAILPSLKHDNAVLTEEEVIRKALASKEAANVQAFVVIAINFDEKSAAWTIRYKDGFISENAVEQELLIAE
ncbi:DUF3221 domain-containing protein [Paenibacillus psychroresistens]|uniref:DUF3221 domain-containing protein n=1 Tax=Paenibacillus psychroresistens TaxID=1778678 RepID=A0A6B8REY3_9BACL|nr:YobA family protein [Paenibacillus psychroresistens]QGQ94115.1 DUF3221 domain-containing protein [Paenibacillus psychroresistens]